MHSGATAADEIERAVRAAGSLQPSRPVVVLYSGGRDSTCLLDLAVRIASAGAVRALHVNYGLREDAEADERHCQQTCDRLEVALEVHRPHPSDRDGNTQAWARSTRYAAARELAAARGTGAAPATGVSHVGAGHADVAAGHTATDQVETILYRLASSPSRRALLGMRPRDEAVIAPAVLLRPLLSYTRADTRAYCEARGLDWREDVTNATDTYARGRVRHELVPVLERVHPGAQANVLALAATLAEEAAVLDELVASVLGEREAVTLETLRGLAPALRRLVVQRLADRALRAPAAGVGRRADDVAALGEHGTHHLDLPAGIRATARRGEVTFAVRGPDARRRI
jgi:tRNA(Ile)-lysidine synthase